MLGEREFRRRISLVATLGAVYPVARAVLELARAQESGDWSRCAELASELHISEEDVSAAYLDSVRWAREVSRA